MAIAEDFKLKFSDPYTITLPKHGERMTMNEMHGFFASSCGRVLCWIAVNNRYDFETRAFYGLTKPTFWQRLYAKIRRWYVMEAWQDCKKLGWKISPGQVVKGAKLLFRGKEEEVEGVLWDREDYWKIKADVWFVGWNNSMPMKKVCRDFTAVEETDET